MTKARDHTVECALQVGKLVQLLTATIEPNELDYWFWALRANLGAVQADLDAQSAEEMSAALAPTAVRGDQTAGPRGAQMEGMPVRQSHI